MNDKGQMRWMPPVVILVAAGLGVALAQILGDADHQWSNILSMLIGLFAVLLCFAWLVLFSGLRRQARGIAGVASLVGVALLLSTVRLRGVTGDWMPIFEWRWSGEPASPTVSPAPGDLETVAGLGDFPQFFGPGRDGKLAGPRLARDWRAQPPAELWRQQVGPGWSGFAVAGRRAITQEQHGPDESVVCYDTVTGNVLWIHRDAARFDSLLAGPGPRATPTIDGELVFTQGATGILNGLDLASGALRWSVDILQDNGAPLPDWGVAGSPLVIGQQVVVSAGGPAGRSLVAYDRSTGAFEWGGGSEPTQWSSPLLAEIAGVPQILIFNGDLSAHDAGDGSVLWTWPWPPGHPRVCLPVVLPGDRVLISTGYGTGSECLQIARDGSGAFIATSLWRSTRMKAKFTNLIALDGFLYGLDDGILACVDLRDGSRMWKAGRYGHGQILLVGGLLLVSTEAGEVVLVDPVPDELRELTRFRALEGKTWNPPVLAGEFLVLRNDREAVCYRLPVAGNPR